jgi:hypothetical protein
MPESIFLLHKNNTMKRFIIVLILVLGLAMLLNPSYEKHQKKLVESYKEKNPVTGMIGAGELLAKATEYENYYVFSATKVTGREERLSFGAYGFVFILVDLDLGNIIEEAKKRLE